MVGTAVAENVLEGKTFTSESGAGLNGTMADRGNLDWNPSSSTSYTIQPGYYSGGTLSTSNAYSAGYNSGYNAGKKSNGVFSLSIGSWVYGYHAGYQTNSSATNVPITLTVTISEGVITGFTLNSSQVRSGEIGGVTSLINAFDIYGYSWTEQN